MKEGWIKLIVFVLAAAALAGAFSHALRVKDEALADMVNSMQLALTEVETQQVVTQVEYGLRYGKQLDYYFGIGSLLRGIHMSSSYLKGVYLTDASGNTLYSTTDTAVPAGLWELLSPSADGDYESCSAGDVTYIAFSIDGDGESIAGRMVLKMDTGAMRYLAEALQEEGRLQSALVGLYALAALAIALARLPLRGRGGRFRPLAAALAICFTVLCALGADLGLETLKIRQEVATNVTRSSQRIAQALQQEIDAVVAKGVSYDDIYGLESYFAENAHSIPSVDGFELDLNNHVAALPSEAYIKDTVARTVDSYVDLWLYVALCALPVILAGILWRHLLLHRERKLPGVRAAETTLKGEA